MGTTKTRNSESAIDKAEAPGGLAFIIKGSL